MPNYALDESNAEMGATDSVRSGCHKDTPDASGGAVARSELSSTSPHPPSPEQPEASNYRFFSFNNQSRGSSPAASVSTSATTSSYPSSSSRTIDINKYRDGLPKFAAMNVYSCNSSYALCFWYLHHRLLFHKMMRLATLQKELDAMESETEDPHHLVHLTPDQLRPAGATRVLTRYEIIMEEIDEELDSYGKRLLRIRKMRDLLPVSRPDYNQMMADLKGYSKYNLGVDEEVWGLFDQLHDLRSTQKTQDHIPIESAIPRAVIDMIIRFFQNGDELYFVTNPSTFRKIRGGLGLLISLTFLFLPVIIICFVDMSFASSIGVAIAFVSLSTFTVFTSQVINTFTTLIVASTYMAVLGAFIIQIKIGNNSCSTQ